MKHQRSPLRELSVLALAVVLAMTSGFRVVQGQAAHVRWDIVSVNFPTTTVSPGGVAFATSPSGSTIALTGSGTFVDPANGGRSNAVTGGGTWETFNSAGVSTGSGTYEVKELADFEFANFQSPGLIDNIGDTNERTNGNAVLKIAYSDGSEGVLWIGCHGPGAPPGIFEGVAATKHFATFNTAQPPAPGVDANRTIFHVKQ